MDEIIEFGRFPVAPTRENLQIRPDRHALAAVMPHESAQMCVAELSAAGLNLSAPHEEIFPYSLTYSHGGALAFVARENGLQFAVIRGEKQRETWDGISDELGWCESGQNYSFVGKRGDDVCVVSPQQTWKLAGAPIPRRFTQNCDGSQIAWIVQGRQQQLWLNGELVCEAREFLGNPTWSPDGTRIAFAFTGEKGVTVRVDNRDFGPHQVSFYKGEPVWSPDNQRCGWLIQRGNQSILVVNGEETILPAKTIQCETLSFSPDGKSWALAARAGFLNFKGRMIINGENGPIYPALGTTVPVWNAGGDAVAYCMARSLKKTFIICDGHESQQYTSFIDGSLTWNPGGGAVGCIAQLDGKPVFGIVERDGESHSLRPAEGFLVRGENLVFDDDRTLHDIGAREDASFFGWTSRF